MKKLLFVLLVFLTSISITFGATAVGSCNSTKQYISTPGDYILTEDMSTTTSCIEINVSNVNLDCQGFNIDGDESSWSDLGIYLNNVDNVNINNCNITEFGVGVSLDSSSYNTFTNMNSDLSKYGFELYSNSSYNNFTNVDVIEFQSDGFSIDGSTDLRFVNVESSSTECCEAFIISDSSRLYFNDVTAASNWASWYLYGTNFDFEFYNILVNNSDAGIYSDDLTNGIIENFTAINSIYESYPGLYFGSGGNISVKNANVNGYSSGVEIWVEDVTVSDSVFTNSSESDFVFSPNSEADCTKKIFTNVNLTGGSPLIIYNTSTSISNQVSPYLFLCNADGSTISNINITASNGYFYSYYSDNMNIDNIFMNGTYDGLEFQYSTNNNVTNSKFSNGAEVIFYNSNDNLVFNSIFELSSYSMRITNSNITIADSNFTSNVYGIYINGDGPTMYNSRIENSTQNGFYFVSTKSTNIYNNFFNNTNNFKLQNTDYVNPFYTTPTTATNIIGGPTIAGNYWATPNGDGFSQICEDTNNDSICDAAYSVTGLSLDNYPLTELGGSVVNYTVDSCSKLSYPGNYVLTQGIINTATSNCIDIAGNNINFDCQGNSIDGNDVAQHGIYIYRGSKQSVNVKVSNCIVADFGGSGNIYSSYASDLTIENVNVSSSPTYGLSLTWGDDVTVQNVKSFGNLRNGVQIYGDRLNVDNLDTYSNSWNGLYITGKDLTVSNVNSYSNSQRGLYVPNTDDSIFSDISSYSNNFEAFNLQGSDSNVLQNLDLTVTGANKHGIYFSSSNNNLIENSKITITSGTSNIGLYFQSSHQNTFRDSNITGTTFSYAIYFVNPSGQNGANILYNNLINTTNHVWGNTAYKNTFNNILAGNYWARPAGGGFSETCADTTPADGFCDNAYNWSFNGPTADLKPLTSEPVPIDYDSILNLTSGEGNQPASYVSPTPPKIAKMTGDSFIINISASDYITNCQITIDGSQFSMTNENTYCYYNISMSNQTMQELIYQVTYDHESDSYSLEERSIKNYPSPYLLQSLTLELPSFGVGSLFVALMFVLFLI